LKEERGEGRTLVRLISRLTLTVLSTAEEERESQLRFIGWFMVLSDGAGHGESRERQQGWHAGAFV
jgi:hypothetical protein